MSDEGAQPSPFRRVGLAPDSSAIAWVDRLAELLRERALLVDVAGAVVVLEDGTVEFLVIGESDEPLRLVGALERLKLRILQGELVDGDEAL